MQKTFIPLLLFVGVRLFGATNPFQIINRTSDLNPNDPTQAAILNALNTAADDLESSVNNGFLSDTSQQTFVSGVSRAQASSQESIAADRASNPQKFSIGVAAQGGYYSATNSLKINANNTLPSVGMSGEAALCIGLNAASLGIQHVGFLDGRRLMFYLSGMTFSHTFSNVAMSFTNIGLNTQYKIVTPKGGSRLLSWGGLDGLLGFDFSSNSVSYSANLTSSQTTDVGSQATTISENLDYSVGVKSTNFSLPLELSTNVSFLYLFTLYGGGSVDLNFGSSHLTGSASGPITASYSGGSVGGVSNLFSGTGALNLDDGISGKPSTVIERAFIGLQLNFGPAKLAGEYYTLSDKTQGGSVILRVAI